MVDGIFAPLPFRQKRLLFVICVAVRILLVALLAKHIHSFGDDKLYLACVLTSAASMYLHIRIKQNDTVWWSRRQHFYASLAVLVLLRVSLVHDGSLPRTLIPAVLLADTVVGAAHGMQHFLL
jgi:hypothetical protein